VAVEALVATREPKAIPELRRIGQTSNDLAWNAAAIRALARLGQADIAHKLLALARTPGEPLAPSALVGLGDLGSAEAVPIVNEALLGDSRLGAALATVARDANLEGTTLLLEVEREIAKR
jgi:HEAT repeat protein